MSSNLGAGLSAAVDEMHAEGPVQDAEVEETPKPKAKAPAKKPAAKPAGSRTVGKQQAAPPAPEAEADESDDVSIDGGEDSDGEAEQPAAKSNPWDSDLDARGINTPEVQSYLSEVIQPYITRLEQQGTPFQALFQGDIEAAQVAAGVLGELDQDPGMAIAKLINVFAEENPNIFDQINEAIGGTPDDGVDSPVGGTEPTAPGNDPLMEQLSQLPEFQKMQEILAQEKAQQEAQEWESYVTEVKAVVPDLDEDLFTMAMAAADGDQDAAFTFYNNYRSKMANQGAPPARKAPPPMMGSGQGKPPATPEKQYTGKDGLKDAIGDWMEVDKATRPRR